MSRAVVAEELQLCAALWPSLNADNPRVLDAFWEVLIGFTDEELRAGFRRVRREHEDKSFPKPAAVAALCGAARGRREWAAEGVNREGLDVKCSACGTVTLYHERTEDGRLGRLWPWHADGCRLRRADQPTDSGSGRLVWPRPNNGGPARAREGVRAVIATTSEAFG